MLFYLFISDLMNASIMNLNPNINFMNYTNKYIRVNFIYEKQFLIHITEISNRWHRKKGDSRWVGVLKKIRNKPNFLQS